jgi:putative thioredoxin
VPLARLLHSRGEIDAAAAILELVTGSFAAEGLLARITLERAGEPDLSAAFAALDAGEPQRGLELLIEALSTGNGARDEIRRVVVGVLDELGADSDLARAMRRRLATALY